MRWYIYLHRDGEEVRFAAETLSKAIDTACGFISGGFDVVKLESALGFTIEAHVIRDLCRCASRAARGQG
jgi:hypothetical protein